MRHIRADSTRLHRIPPDQKRPARRDPRLGPSKPRFRFNYTKPSLEQMRAAVAHIPAIGE